MQNCFSWKYVHVDMSESIKAANHRCNGGKVYLYYIQVYSLGKTFCVDHVYLGNQNNAFHDVEGEHVYSSF